MQQLPNLINMLLFSAFTFSSWKTATTKESGEPYDENTFWNKQTKEVNPKAYTEHIKNKNIYVYTFLLQSSKNI